MAKSKMKVEEKKTSPVEFVSQVRQEVKKVTWPTRKETTMTTAFVFVFALIAAIYFMLVDQVAFRFVRFVLGLGV
jgi:preprotein translocase subunit SecE